MNLCIYRKRLEFLQPYLSPAISASGRGCSKLIHTIANTWRHIHSQLTLFSLPTVMVWRSMTLLFFCSLNFNQVVHAQIETESGDPRIVNEHMQAHRQSWLWFDESGPKDFTLTMLGLAQDLGFAPGRFDAIDNMNNEDALSLPESDEHYSEIFIDLLNEISRHKGNDINLTQEHLRKAADDGQLAGLVDSLVPHHAQVDQLRSKIRQYKKLTTFVWPTFIVMPLNLGQRTPEVSKLRWMLTQLGDHPDKKSAGYRDAIFDTGLINAIKHFQQRHGLADTGKLDEITLTELNVSPSERIEQMRRTIFKWFQLPSDLPWRYVWVNLASFTLDVFEKEASVLHMRVIVGKPLTPTPQMFTQLTKFTINPTWTPPSSIIFDELLPQNNIEPGYLASRGFELRKFVSGDTSVIDLGQLSEQQIRNYLSQYQLVQEPGHYNALGKLRFSIPNTDAIYLHDTPVKSLFNGLDRALSHGCVRLENAIGLLQYLMADQVKHHTSAIKASLVQKSPRYFSLPEPLPVYLIYHTRWIDADGLLQLRPDVYNLDKEV
jgi:murein L,D-transpeptidase YcbB/YkuD